MIEPEHDRIKITPIWQRPLGRLSATLLLILSSCVKDVATQSEEQSSKPLGEEAAGAKKEWSTSYYNMTATVTDLV